MYVRVLFLLYAFANLIKADYSSEAKYIDLLPEDEKTQFLNRIARRIISEIRSRSNTQQTSVEISDERLNEHDAYVKKIINEESQDMKNIRRTEDELKNDRNDDVDFVELKVKPLEQNDPRSQDTLENVDLSTSENKIRIKKATSETNVERSNENTDKVEDTLSTVPVHLLYDEGGNSESTMITRKMDDNEYIVDERLGHNNQVQAVLENTEKRSDKFFIDLKNESKDNESKDQLNEALKNVSTTNLDENEGDNIPRAQTVIYDFEPRQDEVTEYGNDATEKSSEIVRAKQFELDEASEKWIEIPSKNVTEDQLKASISDNEKVVTVNNEKVTEGSTSDYKTVSETSHTSTNNILDTSQWILKTSDNYEGLKSQTVEAISSNKTFELNRNVTESYLTPATPSSFNKVEFERKEAGVASTIQARSVSKEEENEDTDLTTKTSLRINQEDLSDLNEQIGLINNPYPYTTDNNRYQIFEVARDKPIIQSKQINAGFNEAPYYVPVYNFASNNAFYSPYNRFGPNNGNNPEVIEIKEPYHNNELSYDPSKFNLEPKHKRFRSAMNNKQTKEEQDQRKFKYYRNEDEYDIDNKIPYQKIPVMKGKLINIHFNPNDYLDMDYYLGRSNTDNVIPPKHVVKKGKPLEVSNSQDTSHEIIDPISKQPYNMKNVIRNIRLQMSSLKVANDSKAMRSHHHKLQKKLRIVDKILGNPIFNGLNNSLVVFIPKTRTKDHGTKDIRDNIAVDYYYSRMNSGEVPYLDDELATQQELELGHKDITQFMEKPFLKSKTKESLQINDEQRLNIPLKLDNVLKIDLAMKHNNVNVLLRKVKKPKQNDFEILLNAYLNVLKDMIEHNNKGLMNYDWLGSAVDVQSALDKLINLADIMQVSDNVNRYDRDLFKYILFIFKTSLKSLVETKGSRRKTQKGQKSKMEPSIHLLQQFMVWQKNFMKKKRSKRAMPNLNIEVYDYLLKQFEVFLTDLRNNLNQLHEAIKGIASVTTYNRQRWYLDLKELYLTPLDRKASLTLLLHLASTRLFGLIEDSARNGLEADAVRYVRTHLLEVERTREEFLLVLRLLKELNRLKK